jgi:predicted metal-binding membrane protein
MADTALQALLRRDRALIATVLLTLVALSWAYVVWLAHDMVMGGMDMTGYRMIPAGARLMMPASSPWSPIEFGFVFAMWAVMMVGMMIPSAAPMILLYARVARQATIERKPFAPTSWFTGGYLLTWIGFALAATLMQWAVDRLGWLSPNMATTSEIFGGLVLIAVGLYQWTPIKYACLRHCQSPMQFIVRHGGFRPNATGSLLLGVHHGVYCLGCCWMLMALLFVGGVMNVLWIAMLTIFVLLEKVIPAGRIVARISGTGFLAGGVWLIARAL